MGNQPAQANPQSVSEAPAYAGSQKSTEKPVIDFDVLYKDDDSRDDGPAPLDAPNPVVQTWQKEKPAPLNPPVGGQSWQKPKHVSNGWDQPATAYPTVPKTMEDTWAGTA